MRAAIYLRISQDRTGEEAGVTRQLEDCVKLVDALHWTLVETFTDNDVSATNRKKVRKEYKRLLASVKAGELDAIVCWHPDRLYRDPRDLEELIDTIEKQKITVRPVQAGELDLSTASGRGMARILGSISKMEGELKSERWRRSVRQRRENGQVHNFGPRLFGYHRDGTINKTEADLIRVIATALIEGESLRGLTKKVNELGAVTTLGNPWSTQGLKATLTNRRLTGASVLNGDVVGVGQWEPILDDETFEQVQAIFKVRREAGPRPPRVSLLLGVVHCGLCETPLKSGRLGPSHGKRRIYRCSAPPSGQGCGKISVGAEPVEEYVEDVAKSRAADAAVRARVNALSEAAGGAISEILALEQRLRELEDQLVDPEGVPVEALTRAMQRTKEKLDDLRSGERIAGGGVLPEPGAWPTSLAPRAQLIRLALGEVRVFIDPAVVRGRNAFDTDRIRFEPASSGERDRLL